MDAIFPFIPFEGDDHEIRYSLRSLETYSDINNIWLIGHKPDFLDCGHIPFTDKDTAGRAWMKLLNVHRKIRAACQHPEVSDPFLLMNDDFILAAPFEPAHYTFGTLQQLWQRRRFTDSYYTGAIGRTIGRWGNIPNLDTHTPMVIYKDRFLKVGLQQPPILFRSAYGAIEDRVQTVDLGEDVKHYQNLSAEIFQRFIAGRPFFSLSPGFRMFGQLKTMFPRPSHWEI